MAGTVQFSGNGLAPSVILHPVGNAQIVFYGKNDQNMKMSIKQ